MLFANTDSSSIIDDTDIKGAGMQIDSTAKPTESGRMMDEISDTNAKQALQLVASG